MAAIAPNTRFVVALSLASLLVLGAIGCSGKSDDVEALQTAALLELIDGHQAHDPHKSVEVELGRFQITHPLDRNGVLYIEFHLYGILPEERRADLQKSLPAHSVRIRDAVISLVQKTEADQFGDPELALLRAEMVTAINRVLQERLLKDVAFSELSIQRA